MNENKTKHTPGPWRLTLHGNVVSTHGPMVAAVALSEDETPAKSADGLLIAAAPELLEALKEAIQWSPYQGESEETSFLRKARAAIAKAEGRS